MSSDLKKSKRSRDSTYMVLCELDNSTDAGDVNYWGSVSCDLALFRALLQQSQERGGHEVDWGHVDGIEIGPFLDILFE